MKQVVELFPATILIFASVVQQPVWSLSEWLNVVPYRTVTHMHTVVRRAHRRQTSVANFH